MNYEIRESLSWYNDYQSIIKKAHTASSEIEAILNREEKFNSIKNFYEEIGADYSKNNWLIKEEEEINGIKSSEFPPLEADIKFASLLQNALLHQDDLNVNALKYYVNNINYIGYEKFLKKIFYYIHVQQLKRSEAFLDRFIGFFKSIFFVH